MRKVTLSEESYKRLKDNLINEISYGTVQAAKDKSDSLFYEVRTSFEDFMAALKQSMIGEGNDNPYLRKIASLSNEISTILYKKMDQENNFNDELDKVNDMDFYNSEEGEENDIDDIDLRHLQGNYPS